MFNSKSNLSLSPVLDQVIRKTVNFNCFLYSCGITIRPRLAKGRRILEAPPCRPPFIMLFKTFVIGTVMLFSILGHATVDSRNLRSEDGSYIDDRGFLRRLPEFPFHTRRRFDKRGPETLWELD
ncbi:unnamed protein product [Dicrocoelium dendriticum]|nr:unnamed protein product [Dicrocoelium dendriticum]